MAARSAVHMCLRVHCSRLVVDSKDLRLGSGLCDDSVCRCFSDRRGHHIWSNKPNIVRGCSVIAGQEGEAYFKRVTHVFHGDSIGEIGTSVSRPPAIP